MAHVTFISWIRYCILVEFYGLVASRKRSTHSACRLLLTTSTPCGESVMFIEVGDLGEVGVRVRVRLTKRRNHLSSCLFGRIIWQVGWMNRCSQSGRIGAEIVGICYCSSLDLATRGWRDSTFGYSLIDILSDIWYNFRVGRLKV